MECHRHQENCKEIVHQYDIPLIVDLKSRPHLHFHEELPTSLMSERYCIMVTIKFWSFNTNVFAQNTPERGWKWKSKRNFKYVADTTSFLSFNVVSLDCARRQIATQGRELLIKSISLLVIFEKNNKISNSSVLEKKLSEEKVLLLFDPTKITFTAANQDLPERNWSDSNRRIIIFKWNWQISIILSGLITIGDSKRA